MAARRAVVATVVATTVLAVAGDHASARVGGRNQTPGIKILTKDESAALARKRIDIRVRVRRPDRVRITVLALNLGTRPAYVTRARTLNLDRLGVTTRIASIPLTRSALVELAAARATCRSVRIAAFASVRATRRRHKRPRTHIRRNSRTLRPHRKGCRPQPPGLPPPGVGKPPPPPPTNKITIRAGAANADITPPVGTPMFAFTARSNVFGPSLDRPMQILADPDTNLYAKTFEPSQGIHTRVRARAIVIESGGKKYALVQADLGGLPYALTQEVLKRVASTGITGDRLLLSATHTHSSSGAIWSVDNSGYAYVGGDAYDPRVFEQVASGITEAILGANANLTPARIGVGTSELRTASNNRRFESQFVHNTDIPKDPAARRADSIDPRLTVIRVDAADGSPIGVWSNFAVHPTSFGARNLLFSADHPATTERFVEAELAREGSARGTPPAHPPVDVWTNANEGDISPNGDPPTDPTLSSNDPHSALDYIVNSFGGANETGRRVADGVLSAWRDAAPAMTGSPKIDVRHTFMALDGAKADGEPVGPVPILGAGGVTLDDGTCLPADNPAFPGQGTKFPAVIGPGAVPNTHPVSLMRIGPLAVIAFPSELTKQMGKRIRAVVAGQTGGAAPAGTIIAGLTNSYNSYVATPEEYAACAYEGSFTLWGREQGPRYRDLAKALAQSLYGGAPPPTSAAEPPEVSPGTPQPPTAKPTPLAGTVVTDVVPKVTRFGQAVFKWNGGDPSVDAPRDKAFVTLERQGAHGFEPVATEDSVVDVTEHARDQTWTETWQFTECDPLGTYRFTVHGMANKGSGVGPYSATSKPFDLGKSTNISVYSKSVSDGRAHVRAEYGGFPMRPLADLPLRVRTGFAVLTVKKPDGSVDDVVALPDPAGLEFTARVPDGSTIQSISVEDSCGNTSG